MISVHRSCSPSWWHPLQHRVPSLVARKLALISEEGLHTDFAIRDRLSMCPTCFSARLEEPYDLLLSAQELLLEEAGLDMAALRRLSRWGALAPQIGAKINATLRKRTTGSLPIMRRSPSQSVSGGLAKQDFPSSRRCVLILESLGVTSSSPIHVHFRCHHMQLACTCTLPLGSNRVYSVNVSMNYSEY